MLVPRSQLDPDQTYMILQNRDQINELNYGGPNAKLNISWGTKFIILPK